MPQEVPPETVALLRRRYAEGATLPVLKAESGITSLWAISAASTAVRRRLRRTACAAAAAARQPRTRRGAELVRRLWRNAEAQVAQIETRMKTAAGDGRLERDARALAILIRTLRELSAFDEAKRGKRQATAEAYE